MCTSADPAKRPSMSEEAIASVEGENAVSKGGKKQTSPEDSAKQHTQVRMPLSLHQGVDVPSWRSILLPVVSMRCYCVQRNPCNVPAFLA